MTGEYRKKWDLTPVARTGIVLIDQQTGMSHPNTKERIISVAMKLFHDQGYRATGMADILKAAEVGSGSFYHFFSNKEAVLLAVLDKYVELLHPMVMQPAFALAEDPIERIFVVLARYRELIVASEFRFGCPIGNLALEVAADMPSAAEKISLNFNNWCKAIAGCLDSARDRLPHGTDTLALSKFILTVMEGGVMQARAHRSIEPYDISIHQLRDYMNRLTGSPSRNQSTGVVK
jgi:TetR/AcrR family transcriptional repressor of nem operon